MKKTIKRELIIEKLNNVMKAVPFHSDQKLAIADFVTSLLIASDCYNGYTVGDLTRKMDESLLNFKRREVSTRKYY